MAVQFSHLTKEARVGGGQYAFRRYWQRVIPSGLQKCEHITADNANGAYINLGICYDTACKIEIAYGYVGSDTQIFGAAEQSGHIRCMLSAHYSTDVSGLLRTFYYTGDTDFGSGFYPTTDYKTFDKVVNVFEISNGDNPYYKGWDMNLGTYTTQTMNQNPKSGAVVMKNPLFLLGQNYNGAYRGAKAKRVFYFKYWDKNGVLVRDMVPCYVKTALTCRDGNTGANRDFAAGTIGMWDYATGSFFVNAGTSGSFTKGSDVS